MDTERAGGGDEKRRMLIAEDDPKVRHIIARTFPDFDVSEAENGGEALILARELKPDVIITDQRMPKLSGVDFLTRIKEELPHTVRVLVTGYSDYGPLVDAVNAASVHHYFEKPFHTVDLRTVVDTLLHAAELESQRNTLLDKLETIGTTSAGREGSGDLSAVIGMRTRDLIRANEQLTEANSQLRDLAIRDGLTNLFNHRYLMEHIELEVARSKRYEREFCFLFLDLDDFKQINDRYGHATGDEVLCQVASFLRVSPEGLRSSDVAARYGGEEFCVILPETPLEGGKIKAERIRQAIEDHDWGSMSKPLEKVTISIGMATFPRHGHSAEDILTASDAALYLAKQRGKNCVMLGERQAKS